MEPPEAIEQLRHAVDAALALDLDALSDGELHAAVVALQRQRARLGAAAAALLARWDSRMVWVSDGSRTAATRLARDTNSAVSSAKAELRRARQLTSMPATSAAVAAGRLSLDHLDLLGRANRPWRDAVFAEHEAVLVEQCSQLGFADAVKTIDYWCQRADGEAADADAERRAERAHLHVSSTLDRDVVITGRLDPIGGAIVAKELARLERELYVADKRAAVSGTAAQRRARALAEMATRSATVATIGRRPRPLFTVLVGDRSLARVCELADGTVLTPGQLAGWAGSAELETILFDGPSTVISVSRRRSFTGALRRAVEVRDRHCRHSSGCDQPAEHCDVDHIVPRARGGETSQFNGRLECPTHNRHADRHDHDATPLPSRPVTRLDELRARLRWRYQHGPGGDDGDEGDLRHAG